MERFLVKIQGTRPLLMHFPHKESFSATRERGRSEFLPEKEAPKGLYRDKEGKICVPSICIESSMREAGKDRKMPGRGGRKSYSRYILSGIRISPEFIPLRIPDGSDPENSWEIDIRPVVVKQNRVFRARPRFDSWELEFTLGILDIATLDSKVVKDIMEDAGKFYGLLDFRPRYGLFRVEEFRELS